MCWHDYVIIYSCSFSKGQLAAQPEVSRQDTWPQNSSQNCMSNCTSVIHFQYWIGIGRTFGTDLLLSPSNSIIWGLVLEGICSVVSDSWCDSVSVRVNADLQTDRRCLEKWKMNVSLLNELLLDFIGTQIQKSQKLQAGSYWCKNQWFLNQ